jgi:hypothetical protein
LKYAVLLGELTDLMMLELQDWPDLFVGKIARCGYVPYALPHGLLKLAPMRHCFAVGTAHRMGGEERLVVGNGAFDPVRLDGRWLKPLPLSFARFHATAATLGAGVSSCFATASRHISTSENRLSSVAEKNRYQPIPNPEHIGARCANPGAHANNS